MTPGITLIVDSLFLRARRNVAIRAILFGESCRGLDPLLTDMLVRAYHDEVHTTVEADAAVLRGVGPETRDVVAAYAVLARSPTSAERPDTPKTEMRRRLLACVVVEAVRMGCVPGVAHAASAAFDAVAEVSCTRDLHRTKREARELRAFADGAKPARVSADLAALAALSNLEGFFAEACLVLLAHGAPDRYGIRVGADWDAVLVPGDPRKSTLRLSGEACEALSAWRPRDGA